MKANDIPVADTPVGGYGDSFPPLVKTPTTLKPTGQHTNLRACIKLGAALSAGAVALLSVGA